MTARVVSASEAEILSSVHAQCFSEVWSAPYIASLLATPGTFACLSECQNGFILMRVAGDEAEVLTLAVAPAARRRGVAAELLTTAAIHASRVGAAVVFLEVDCTNLPAIALYKRLGFVEVGRRKGYYPGHDGARNDALVYRGGIPLSRVGNCMQLG